jgi:hypothetical protein
MGIIDAATGTGDDGDDESPLLLELLLLILLLLLLLMALVAVLIPIVASLPITPPSPSIFNNLSVTGALRTARRCCSVGDDIAADGDITPPFAAAAAAGFCC